MKLVLANIDNGKRKFAVNILNEANTGRYLEDTKTIDIRCSYILYKWTVILLRRHGQYFWWNFATMNTTFHSYLTVNAYEAL
jgi:hypothetical protein